MDNTLLLVLIGIIGMLLLSVAIVVFFVIYQKRLFTQEEELKDIKALRQKELLDASIQTQEAERGRIAHDLHDGVGSLLSALRLYLQQFSPDQPKAQYLELKDETLQIIDNTIDQVRSISQDLLPNTLERFGVIGALDDHAKKIEKLHPIKVHLEASEALKFKPEEDLALFRIVQELINNTLKYAQAQQIDIQIQKADQVHLLDYKDDGQGFDLAQVQKSSSGLGLKSIESRVNYLNGVMQMQSAEGAGFSFKMEF